MKKVALYGVFSETIRHMFQEQLSDRYEIIEFSSPDEADKLKDVSFMVNRAYSVDKFVLDNAPMLELVQKWGAGFDKIDVKEARARGVSVAICYGVNSEPVAELAILLIMAVYRNILPLANRLKAGDWARDRYISKSFMLHGKTVGLLGLGNIGRKTGTIAKNGFDAKIQYHDIVRLSEKEGAALGFKYTDLDTLLRTSDVVSIHLPLTKSTQNMIDEEALSKMKRSAVIINTSRGGIIDETALFEALSDGRIAGAGLDTLAIEPADPACPLLQLENVVVSPHCGGNTGDNDINMLGCCVENILQYEKNGCLQPPALVN